MKISKKTFSASLLTIFCFLFLFAFLFALPTAAEGSVELNGNQTVNGVNGTGNYRSEDGSIFWDADTATLTLNNASLTHWTGIYFQDPDDDACSDGVLTVKLIGQNRIDNEDWAGWGIVTNGNMIVTAEEGASLTINASGDRLNALTASNTITIQGGSYDLNSVGVSIHAGGSILIEDGAHLTAEAANEVAIYSARGNITVQDGANVTCTATGQVYIEDDDQSYPTSAMYAETGTVIITGQNTVAELHASGSALNGTGGVHVGDGATVTGEAGGAGIYSYTGNITVDGGAHVKFNTSASSALFAYTGTVTVTGEGTVAELTAYYCALQAAGDLTIEDGAHVTGTSTNDSAIYTSSGNITITGKDTTAELTGYYCAIKTAGNITMADGASVTGISNTDTAFYTSNGNFTLESGASLTVPSAAYSAVWTPAGSITVTGKGTTAKLTPTLCALSGVTGVEISDGAEVTGSSATNSAIYCKSGDITVTGEGTKVDCTAHDCVLNSAGSATVSDGAEVKGASTDNSAIYAASGALNVTGQGTNIELTAKETPLNIFTDIVISDGASVKCSNDSDNPAIYTWHGNITVSSGAHVTVTATPDSALRADEGSITVKGQGTTANLTAVRCMINAQKDARIEDGAVVTGSSSGNTAINSKAGNITFQSGASVTVTASGTAVYAKEGSLTVTGQETKADLKASNTAVNIIGDITVSDGADLIAVGEVCAMYSQTGDITLDGANLSLTSKGEEHAGLHLGDGEKSLTIKNSTLTVDSVGSAVYALGSTDIADSHLTLHSQGGAAIECKKALTITGTETTVEATGAKPVHGDTVTIQGASVSSESTGKALYAEGNITVSDGAVLTAKATGEEEAVVSQNGSIRLEGEATTADVTAAKSYGIAAYNGRIVLNTEHVKVSTAEGADAIMAREQADSAEGIPETRIEIGEGLQIGDNQVVTTVWKLADDGSYYADTLIVPSDTELNGQGLLEGAYSPANLVVIEKEVVYILGDVNNDGKVNTADRTYLARAFSNWKGYSVPPVETGDVNRDGVVNVADRTYLARALSNWQGYTVK